MDRFAACCGLLARNYPFIELNRLEQTGSTFDVTATPLRHTIEFGSCTLEYRLELDVGQMSLENDKK